MPAFPSKHESFGAEATDFFIVYTNYKPHIHTAIGKTGYKWKNAVDRLLYLDCTVFVVPLPHALLKVDGGIVALRFQYWAQTLDIFNGNCLLKRKLLALLLLYRIILLYVRTDFKLLYSHNCVTWFRHCK
jgi:hypothetical protein